MVPNAAKGKAPSSKIEAGSPACWVLAESGAQRSKRGTSEPRTPNSFILDFRWLLY